MILSGGDNYPPGHKNRMHPGRKEDLMAEEMKRNMRVKNNDFFFITPITALKHIRVTKTDAHERKHMRCVSKMLYDKKIVENCNFKNVLVNNF